MRSQTPMMRQYFEIKRQHPEMLLFFRLGDFYEMFFEDAVTAARELEITLTSRNSDRDGKPIPMCGVPYHALDIYLPRLIKKGFKVALCEQVEDPRQVKGIVRREVTRIVTPGTTIDEGVLEAGVNNFLSALVTVGKEIGAAFVDISTGEFWATQFGDEFWSEAIQTVQHFAPSEMLLPAESRSQIEQNLGEQCVGDLLITPLEDWNFQLDYSQRQLLEQFDVRTLEGLGLESASAAVAAAGALVHYLRQTQKSTLDHIVTLRYFQPARYLKLDETTIRNLELIKDSEGGRRWTLLKTIDSTHTGMGGRLLRSWLLRPSLQLEEIDSRLDAVEELLGRGVEMGRLGTTLDTVHDIERILSRVTLGTAGPRDLLSLRESFKRIPILLEKLKAFSAPALCGPIEPLEELTTQLEDSLNDEAPVNLADGGVIRPGYDAQLDDLREIASSGKSFIARLEACERERTGLPKLRVKYNKVFGYFIEVSRVHSDQVPDDYIRKQTLVSTERFITPELKEYEEKVLTAEERMLTIERELFQQLRATVASEADRILKTAARIAEIDVLLSFAEISQQRRYHRPQLDESTELDIRGGRHPILELQGNEPFVPNDLKCNTTSDQLLILTGPNMGGKSTYLRQNALIVILAQMGCFVPAESARIGLVDRIYTRVGASDNLARGRSTFMVEMIETANILNTSTARSLLLLDEVGRGTATFDGLSLAWSIAEFLITEEPRRARTLFATHYHELTKLEKLYPGVRNYCVTIRESNGEIIFFHRVMPGIASKSYGIEVARLAGLPAPVLLRAREILSRLERKELNVSGRKRSSRANDALDDLQPALF